jgi:hypothetical protein
MFPKEAREEKVQKWKSHTKHNSIDSNRDLREAESVFRHGRTHSSPLNCPGLGRQNQALSRTVDFIIAYLHPALGFN